MNHIVYQPDARLNRVESFIDGIRYRHQGFQAPFSERRLVLITGDLLIVALATAVSILLRDLFANSDMDVLQVLNRWYLFIPWFVIWSGSSLLNDLYDIPTSYDRTSTMSRVLLTGQLSFVLYLPISFVLPSPISGRFAALSTVLAIPTVIAWRLIYIKLSALRTFHYRFLIVGTGKSAKSIAGLLKEKAELNFEVLGYVDEKATGAESGTDELSILGDAKALPRLIGETRAHEIVLAPDHEINRDLFQSLIECQAHGVRLTWMPDLYARLRRQVPVEDIDAGWAFQAIQGQALFWRLQLAMKRVMDLTLLLFGLPVLVFLLPMLALAIRLDSAGPVFYRQVRCGRAGKLFSIFKFRTMVSDAEKDGKARWARKGDSRITRVGSFLRKSRLDELPQLLNILLGDMSFIGPRPERPDFVQLLRHEVPFYDTRMMVKPGLTGWAQVHYDYGNTTEDARVKLQYDFYYMYRWSVWMDLYILFRTFAVVLKLKGV